jgi:L-aspartate semialdehyde sulfurtransferase ferredoxin
VLKRVSFGRKHEIPAHFGIGMERRRLKLIFGPSLVKEPVIYQLGRKFEIVTNIRRADVTKDHGWVLLEVSGEPEELERGVQFLESRGVRVEPAEGDLVE